jgi:hypothetical protein
LKNAKPQAANPQEGDTVASVTMGLGVLLIGLGVGTYVYISADTDKPSITALIPAFFGVAFLILGALGRSDRLRKHAMHLAAMVGLIGFILAGYRAFPSVICYLIGEEVPRPAAAVETTLMAILCAVFVVLCVRSFVAARRARRGA